MTSSCKRSAGGTSPNVPGAWIESNSPFEGVTPSKRRRIDIGRNGALSQTPLHTESVSNHSAPPIPNAFLPQGESPQRSSVARTHEKEVFIAFNSINKPGENVDIVTPGKNRSSTGSSHNQEDVRPIPELREETFPLSASESTAGPGMAYRPRRFDGTGAASVMSSRQHRSIVDDCPLESMVLLSESTDAGSSDAEDGDTEARVSDDTAPSHGERSSEMRWDDGLSEGRQPSLLRAGPDVVEHDVNLQSEVLNDSLQLSSSNEDDLISRPPKQRIPISQTEDDAPMDGSTASPMLPGGLPAEVLAIARAWRNPGVVEETIGLESQVMVHSELGLQEPRTVDSATPPFDVKKPSETRGLSTTNWKNALVHDDIPLHSSVLGSVGFESFSSTKKEALEDDYMVTHGGKQTVADQQGLAWREGKGTAWGANANEDHLSVQGTPGLSMKGRMTQRSRVLPLVVDVPLRSLVSQSTFVHSTPGYAPSISQAGIQPKGLMSSRQPEGWGVELWDGVSQSAQSAAYESASLPAGDGKLLTGGMNHHTIKDSFVNSSLDGDDGVEGDTEDNSANEMKSRRRQGIKSSKTGKRSRRKVGARSETGLPSQSISIISRPPVRKRHTFPDREMKDPLDDGDVSEPEDEGLWKDADLPISPTHATGYSWDAYVKMDSLRSGHELRLRRIADESRSNSAAHLDEVSNQDMHEGPSNGVAFQNAAVVGFVRARFLNPDVMPAGNELVLKSSVLSDADVDMDRLSSESDDEVAIPASLTGRKIYKSDVTAATNRLLLDKMDEITTAVGEVKLNIESLMPASNVDQAQRNEAGPSSSDSEAHDSAGPLRTNEPRRRGEDAITFARIIREELAIIQQRRPVDLPQQSAGIADIERWGRYKRHGPTTDDGLPLWLTSSAALSPDFKKYVSSWDHACFLAFFAWLIDSHPTYKNREREARKRFFNHLRTIRKKYQNHLKGPDSTAQSRTQNNARQRRINRHARRLEICRYYKDKYPEMREFYKIFLYRFSWKACSGDEADGEICPITKKPRHLITKLTWRASEVREWLKLIDAIGRAKRFTGGDRSSGGNFAEPRYDAMDFDEPRVIRERFNNGYSKGLPRNFYDDRWFGQLEDHEVEELNPAPPLSLELSHRLQRKARKGMRVTDRTTPPQVLSDSSGMESAMESA